MLTLIPARGGSRRIPRKNARLLGGHPLVAWSIMAAKAAGLDPVVSSDDTDILFIAMRYGALPLSRPAALATDTATTEAVALHALKQKPADAVLLLQPTSPFRAPWFIGAALTGGEPRVVACLEGRLRGQHIPTGALYFAPASHLRNGGTFTEPGFAPFFHNGPSVLDLDTERDWRRAENALRSPQGRALLPPMRNLEPAALLGR